MPAIRLPARGNYDEVLQQADVVSLHCNLTDETRGMVRTEKIAGMKDGVVILNCARGEIVETADMVEALKSGKVGGYGIATAIARMECQSVRPPAQVRPKAAGMARSRFPDRKTD